MTARYTHTRHQAEAEIRKAAERCGGTVTIMDDLMLASPPAAYRLTFLTGGANARKSSRSDRWCVEHGIG